MKWFSYCREGVGFRLHDTEQAARAVAQNEFDDWFDADCAVPDSMAREVVWGRVYGLPRKVETIETPDGECDCEEQWEIRSPDETIEVRRKRRWTDKRGDEHEEIIDVKGGE